MGPVGTYKTGLIKVRGEANNFLVGASNLMTSGDASSMFTVTVSSGSITLTLVPPYSWYLNNEPTNKLVVYVGQVLKLITENSIPEVSVYSLPYCQLASSGPALSITSSTQAIIFFDEGGFTSSTNIPSDNIFYSSTPPSFSFIIILTFFN
jgi:hypothetical protein